MSQLPDFAGAKTRNLEAALKARGRHPLELHRVNTTSRLYPGDRQLAAYRGKDGRRFMQPGHELQSKMIMEPSQ
ncbi:MAG: hypothetical protein ACLFQT_09515 [Thiohalophilus sp.]